MSNRTWCDKHPHDCARVQKQQEREWLHAHEIAFGPLDIVVAAVIVGICVLATL
ncbi:MAG: hypothetical protein AAFQ38_18155 [Pseudomonadota bacterium]